MLLKLYESTEIFYSDLIYKRRRARGGTEK